MAPNATVSFVLQNDTKVIQSSGRGIVLASIILFNRFLTKSALSTTLISDTVRKDLMYAWLEDVHASFDSKFKFSTKKERLQFRRTVQLIHLHSGIHTCKNAIGLVHCMRKLQGV